MLYVPASQLRPGMILARDLPSDVFGFSLVTTGQTLTQKSILRIIEIGIPGVYVQSSLMAEVDFKVEDVISPATQKKLITGVRKQFDDYYNQAVISDESISSFYKMSADIVTSVLSKDYVFVNLVNIKRYDDYTYAHSAMVALIATMIGTRLGMKRQDLEAISTCGLMHDIGKVEIPVSIINKPAKLTDAEMDIIRSHPDNAVRRLRDNRRFNCMVLRGIECHHEKYDGTGYPHHLVGEEIPLFGRILALADVFDALTSKRPYRDGWPADQAIEYMMGLANIHFDHQLLTVFLSVIAAYPVGTAVQLSNGYIGVVISNTPGMTLRPTVKIVSPDTAAGLVMDLANDMKCLSVTVSNTITNISELPDGTFMLPPHNTPPAQEA